MFDQNIKSSDICTKRCIDELKINNLFMSSFLRFLPTTVNYRYFFEILPIVSIRTDDFHLHIFKMTSKKPGKHGDVSSGAGSLYNSNNPTTDSSIPSI